MESSPDSRVSEVNVQSKSNAMEVEVGVESRTDASLSLADILVNPEHRILLLKITVTLTLGIMGGAILPVSWGFQQTGITWGFGIMLAVSLANVYTCELLLRQAEALGVQDYETLSLTIGGRFYKYFTDFGIVILLYGSLLGGIQQFGEAGAIGLQGLSSKVPHWLTGRDGSFLMAFGTIIVAFPLCLHSRLQELDKAASLGTALVLWLLVVILVDSIKHGLPAIANGQLPIVGLPKIKYFSQATSIFGFAFYIQPIMMTYLLEVPPGKGGISILKWATRFVVVGISFAVYGIIGLFGAARHGDQTSENILQNKWMGGGIGQGFLNLSISLYLALSVPLMEFPIRHTISSWFIRSKNNLWIRISVSALILSLSLGLALIFPNNSGQVLVVTGAVGVCIISYTIPIINHFCLFFKGAKLQENIQDRKNGIEASNSTSREISVCNDKTSEDNGRLPSTFSSEGLTSYRRKRNGGTWNMMVELTWEIVVPTLVVIIGFLCGVMSLSTL